MKFLNNKIFYNISEPYKIEDNNWEVASKKRENEWEHKYIVIISLQYDNFVQKQLTFVLPFPKG